MFLSHEALDFTIHIGSTPTFLYFDLYFISLLYGHDTAFFKNNRKQEYKITSVK